MGRAFKGYGVKQAVTTGATIALALQLLIFTATLLSYLLGVDTHFSNPLAIVGEDRVVSLREAMGARAAGIAINVVIGSVAAVIGWALGRLLPARPAPAEA